MKEIEVKIEVSDLEDIKKRILSCGASLEKRRFLEENTLYDYPSQSLYEKGEALRLRKINKKYFLTFKGSPQKSRKFKVREEYETEVKNGKQFQKILKKLNLKPVFNYKKYRTLFRKRGLKICLDETLVGDFIELEGDREQIVRFALALGFSKKDFVKQDYIQLIKNKQK